MKDIDSLHDKIEGVDRKLDSIDGKLTCFLERIVVVEERERTDRGAISIMFTTFLTFLGYLVYRLKLSL